jgi:hypothetical protein
MDAPIATRTTYEYPPDAIRQMLAERLKVPLAQVTVDYVIQQVHVHPLDHYPGAGEVTKVRVTVTQDGPR